MSLKSLIDKIKFRLRLLGGYYFNKRLAKGKHQMLFIFGHMRSGSSLLTQILSSHKDIIGVGELHNKYVSKKDFGKSAYDISLLSKKLIRKEKYILDKVLTTRLLQNPELIKDCPVIIPVRGPERTLQSILELNIKPWYVTYQSVLDNYTQRMHEIMRFAKAIPPNNWVWFTYEELVETPKEVFAKIEKLLDLDEPLQENYKVQTIEREGIGDPSENLKAGKILKRKAKTDPPEVLPYVEKARIDYNKCIATLQRLNPHK